MDRITEDKDRPEVLKEQIRIKNSELKRLENEIERQEEKVKQVLQNNQKKIRELQEKINEKEEETRFHQGLASNLLKEKQQYEKDAENQASISSEENALNLKRLDRAIGHLKVLKKNNAQLALKLDQENLQRERLIKEKGLLAREIRKLRNLQEPEVDEGLKKRVENLEKEIEASRTRYESLLEEKDKIIQSYTSTLNEVADSSDATPQTLKSLRFELGELKNDKKKLENALARERKMFQARLSRDVAFLEEQIEQNIKKKLHRKKKGAQTGEESENLGEGWMTTYADMVTLLLTFFILYYSISSVTMKKLRAAASDSNNTSAEIVEILDSAQQPQKLETLTGLRPDTIVEEANDLTKQDNLGDIMKIEGNQNRLVFMVSGEALFPSGQADLNLDTSKDALNEIINLSKRHPGYLIKIGGHTDDNPISTDKFPTNWELSAARATAVLRYFIDRNIPATRVTALGYAATYPVARNDTPGGRQLNRRVEIVLEKKG